MKDEKLTDSEIHVSDNYKDILKSVGCAFISGSLLTRGYDYFLHPGTTVPIMLYFGSSLFIFFLAIIFGAKHLFPSEANHE